MRALRSILLIPVGLACADKSARNAASTALSDSAGVQVIEASAPIQGARVALLVDSVPELVIGAEGGDEAHELYRVSDALKLSDGRIVVANTGTSDLRVFDATGRFITRVGRAGGGPGEFGSSPIRLHFVGGELLAYDAEAFRLHAYDSALNLIETRGFKLTPDIPRASLRGVLADGSWLATVFFGGGVLSGPPGSVITTRFSLAHFDSLGNFEKRFGNFSGRQRYVNSVETITHYPHLPCTVDAAVLAYGNEIAIVRGDRPEIEIWNVNGALTSLVRWSRARVRSAEVYPRYRELAIAGLASANERTRRLYGAFYAKDLPLPEYAAMYEAALVDSAQRVWLLRYRLPGDEGENQWDVIEKSGHWLGAVSTPRYLEIFRIGGSHVVGRMRDSLGVERVALHRLRVEP